MTNLKISSCYTFKFPFTALFLFCKFLPLLMFLKYSITNPTNTTNFNTKKKQFCCHIRPFLAFCYPYVSSLIMFPLSTLFSTNFSYYHNFHSTTQACPEQCSFSSWYLHQRPDNCLHNKAHQHCSRIDLWWLVKTVHCFATNVQERLALCNILTLSVTFQSIWSKECIVSYLRMWQQRVIICLYEIKNVNKIKAIRLKRLNCINVAEDGDKLGAVLKTKRNSGFCKMQKILWLHKG